MLKHVEQYNEPTGSRINKLDIEPFIKLYPDVQLEHAFFKELNGKGTDELIEIFSQRYLTDAPENTIVTLTAKDNEMIAKLKGQLNKTCYIKEYTPGYTWQWIIEKEQNKGNQVFNIEHFLYIKDEGRGFTSRWPQWFVTDQNDMEILKEAIEYFEPRLEEIANTLKLSNQMQNQIIRESVTPEKVMKYAYEHMLPKEKASFKLAFDITYAYNLEQMIALIRKYLREFPGKIKFNKFNEYSIAKNLAKKAKGTPYRRQYIAELTEMKPNSREFIEDYIHARFVSEEIKTPIKEFDGLNISIEEVKELNTPAVKSAGKSLLKRLFPFLAFAAVLTAGTITEVSANNNFNNAYTVSPRNLSKTKTKIENGEATVQEQWAFYTDKRNEDLVKTDPVHTWKFVELWEGVVEAEEILLEFEKESKEQRTKEIEKSVENSLLNNYQKQASKTDFGAGTF